MACQTLINLTLNYLWWSGLAVHKGWNVNKNLKFIMHHRSVKSSWDALFLEWRLSCTCWVHLQWCKIHPFHPFCMIWSLITISKRQQSISLALPGLAFLHCSLAHEKEKCYEVQWRCKKFFQEPRTVLRTASHIIGNCTIFLWKFSKWHLRIHGSVRQR